MDQAMKSEDEIMAEYLLKGGKMLSKTCASCGCPLFDYKGETLCVVCREEQAAAKERKKPRTGEKTGPAKGSERAANEGESPAPGLVASIEETLQILSLRVREEPDPERILLLMNSIKRGIEALNLLR
jgi:UPF0148 protein